MFEKSKYIANLLPKPADNRSWMEKFSMLPLPEREKWMDDYAKQLLGRSPEEEDWIVIKDSLKYNWKLWARQDQLPPAGNDWSCWTICAGRGWGKTRVMMEMVKKWVDEGVNHIGIIGRTTADVRSVLMRGESGLLSLYPENERPIYTETTRLVKWKNGAEALCFSAQEPELLRGPQYEKVVVDELAAWRYGEYALDMMMMGLRIGDNPQFVVATTPKPVPALLKLLKKKSTVTTQGTTFENKTNLAPKFLTDITEQYENTRIGRQELMAEIMESVPGALWDYENLEKHRIKLVYDEKGSGRFEPALPDFLTVVLAIDPAIQVKASSAETAMCVVAFGSNHHYYVLHLDSHKDQPIEWAERAVRLFKDYNCDKMVAEANQGGLLVESNIHTVAPLQKVHMVHASRGKITRAEPVSALYQQGKVHHVGAFPAGESQMTQFNPIENPSGLKDMVDSLVWAVTKITDDYQVARGYAPQVGGIRNKLVQYKVR